MRKFAFVLAAIAAAVLSVSEIPLQLVQGSSPLELQGTNWTEPVLTRHRALHWSQERGFGNPRFE